MLFRSFGFFPKLLAEKIKPVTEQIVNMATVSNSAPAQVVETNAPPALPNPTETPATNAPSAEALAANAPALESPATNAPAATTGTNQESAIQK